METINNEIVTNSISGAIVGTAGTNNSPVGVADLSELVHKPRAQIIPLASLKGREVTQFIEPSTKNAGELILKNSHYSASIDSIAEATIEGLNKELEPLTQKIEKRAANLYGIVDELGKLLEFLTSLSTEQEDISPDKFQEFVRILEVLDNPDLNKSFDSFEEKMRNLPENVMVWTTRNTPEERCFGNGPDSMKSTLKDPNLDEIFKGSLQKLKAYSTKNIEINKKPTREQLSTHFQINKLLRIPRHSSSSSESPKTIFFYKYFGFSSKASLVLSIIEDPLLFVSYLTMDATEDQREMLSDSSFMHETLRNNTLDQQMQKLATFITLQEHKNDILNALSVAEEGDQELNSTPLEELEALRGKADAKLDRITQKGSIGRLQGEIAKNLATEEAHNNFFDTLNEQIRNILELPLAQKIHQDILAPISKRTQLKRLEIDQSNEYGQKYTSTMEWAAMQRAASGPYETFKTVPALKQEMGAAITDQNYQKKRNSYNMQKSVNMIVSVLNSFKNRENPLRELSPNEQFVRSKLSTNQLKEINATLRKLPDERALQLSFAKWKVEKNIATGLGILQDLDNTFKD